MITILIDVLIGGNLVIASILIGVILILILLKKLRIQKRKKDSEEGD
jgi:hypothetical protein